MKLRKMLSAVMAGVVAVTAAVSSLTLNAGADWFEIPDEAPVIVSGKSTSISLEPRQNTNVSETMVYKFIVTDSGKFRLDYNSSSYYVNVDFCSRQEWLIDNSNVDVSMTEGQSYAKTYRELNGTVDYFSGVSFIWDGDTERCSGYCEFDIEPGEYYIGFTAMYDSKGNGAVPFEKLKDEFGDGRITVKATYPSADTTSKLSAPTTLKATAKSATSAGLTWKSTGADSYNIYRSTSKTGTYKKIGTSTKASYTDKGLSKGKTYYYKVTAVSGDKESEFSKAVSVKAAAPAPSTVKAVKAKSGAAKITWKKTSGASGYEIYMSTSANSGFKKIKTAGAKSAASFTKTGLKSGQTYYFKIRTYTSVNGKKVYSGFSKVVKVIV